MRNQFYKLIRSRRAIFALLMTVSFLFYWYSVAHNSSTNLIYYFVNDTQNTFMDFFNPIMKMPAVTYTEPCYSNYPAFANLLFVFVKGILPPELNSDSDAMRKSMFSLIYIIIFLLCCVLILEKLVKKFLIITNTNTIVNHWVTYVIIFSGPFLFCYERGNNLLLALIFLMIFLLYYEDERRVCRHIALICLALSSAIKIYPAVFGIFLIKKGAGKDVLWAVFYGVLFLFVPFWIGYDGMESVVDFFRNIVVKNEERISMGLGYNFSFATLVRIMRKFFSKTYVDELSASVILFPIINTVILYITSKVKWKKAFAICMFIIWIPNNSYTYLLCFMVVPFLLYMRENDIMKKQDWFYIIGFGMIFSLYSLPRIDWINEGVESFQLSWGMVLIHIVLIAMTTFIFAENILEKLSKE